MDAHLSDLGMDFICSVLRSQMGNSCAHIILLEFGIQLISTKIAA